MTPFRWFWVLLTLPLLAGLLSDSFDERVASENTLRRCYPLSGPVLAFGAESPDPEVAYRCKRVLAGVRK